MSAGGPEASDAEAPSYSFVAAPDFLNQDVGDVTRRPGWDRGEPNSWTPQLQSSIDTFLDEIAARQPQSVLVPGDMVEGHWLGDVADTGVFGPEDTDEQKLRMVRRAGDFYHRQWVKRFQRRGLTVHTAVGDHEIGDNPWGGRRATSPDAFKAAGGKGNGGGKKNGGGKAGRMALKRAAVPVFKAVYAKHHVFNADGSRRYSDYPAGTPWADTAYSVQLAPEVLLVSLDVFNLTRDDVRAEVVGGQLQWLRRTLSAAQARGTEWVVVQGHTPILTPVRTRGSSGMTLDEGADSPLWKVLARYGVDLYLAGEVHDTTMTQRDGVTQIATGGLMFRGKGTYMSATVYDDRVEFDVREFSARLTGSLDPLWQVGKYTSTGGYELVPGSSRSVGSLTLTADGVALAATGKLEPLT